jgi:uncharacterized RDD family membrane protein YckC
MSTPTSPGWYEDPEDPDQLRYFDGIVWSSHTTPRRTPPAPVSTEPGTAVPTGWGQPPGPSGQQPGWGGQQPPEWRAPQGGGQQQGWGDGQQRNPWAAPPVAGAPVGWTTRTDVLPDGAVLAEWWRRLIARIIDWIVIGLIGALLSAGYLTELIAAVEAYFEAAVRAAETGATPDTTALESALVGAALPITLISLAVTVVYDVLFLVWRGATPGKMLLGTVVRPAEHPGPVSLVVALRRQVIYVVSNLVGLVPVVGVLGTILSVVDPAWLLWDRRRQALHDKVADTVVVLRRP